MGKKKALFDTNWKSRAKAAEALVDSLRAQLNAKTQTLTVEDPMGGRVTATIPFHPHVFITNTVSNVVFYPDTQEVDYEFEFDLVPVEDSDG